MRSSLAWCLVLSSTVAFANGRPPLTNGVTFKPGDPHTLYVRSTFGLLSSPDDGCTMYWTCEDALGYGGTFDPIYRVASDGSLFATTYSGLRVSRDGGCSFATNTTLPANTWISALDIGPTGEVWVGTATSGASNDVYVSTDNGATFASRGMVSPTIWWQSVAVAPSNASRVYVSGYAVASALPTDAGQPAPVAHFERTDDDGQTWTDEPVSGLLYGPTPILMTDAIDPSDPDILYVVSVGANRPNGDIVYRSSDGGGTFTQLLATTDTVRGIVPFAGTNVMIATQFGGSFLSSDRGVTFNPVTTAPQLSCLGLSPDGTLIGCGPNWDPNFMSVARSSDGGMTWSEVWRFVNLYGPAQCPAGTPEHDTCGQQQWPTLQQQFATTGPTCGPLANQTAVDAGTTSPPPRGGGCHAGQGAVPPLAGLVLVVGLWLGRRRRAA
jgi:uncharacterized protein (TIGR03382 family)